MSRGPSTEEVANAISDLSAHLATWVSNPANHQSLADAIEASLISYENEREKQVHTAGTATTETINTGWVLGDILEWGKWGAQTVIASAIDAATTHSAAYFRKNYPVISSTNAYHAFKSLELAPGGWANEKHAMYGLFGRPSLKTRMVSAVVALSFEKTATLEEGTLKSRVTNTLSLMKVDGQASKLYTEMLGAIAERLREQKQSTQLAHAI